MMFSDDCLAHFKLNFQLTKESVEYFLSTTTVHVAFEAVSKLHVEDLSYLLRIVCRERDHHRTAVCHSKLVEGNVEDLSYLLRICLQRT